MFLETTGTFSLFWFLPVPRKLMVWWKAQDAIRSEILMPGVLRVRNPGKGDPHIYGLDCKTLHHIRAQGRVWSDWHWFMKDYVVPLFWFLAVILIRTATPIGILACMICSPVVVFVTILVSMHSSLSSTSWWTSFLRMGGLFNQISNMWALRELEFISIFRFTVLTTSRVGDTGWADAVNVRKKMPQWVFETFQSKWKSLLLLGYFDVGMVAKVFQLAYKDRAFEKIPTLLDSEKIRQLLTPLSSSYSPLPS